MQDLNIIIVGAGIGGLQTALALAHDGHNVTVLESAKVFEEVSRILKRDEANADGTSRSARVFVFHLTL
jgi:salicylate hydroxylase